MTSEQEVNGLCTEGLTVFLTVLVGARKYGGGRNLYGLKDLHGSYFIGIIMIIIVCV